MLNLKNISVTFNAHTPFEKKSLNNFNLHINPGEFVIILGGNGAGKTTLFNTILGTIPYEGIVTLENKNINKEKTYQRTKNIGIVYQDPLKGTAPNLTVLENILLATKEKKILNHYFNKQFILNVKKELATYELDLENQLLIKAKLLSGGQRQALTLYMACLSKPKLLLLDEHTAALDPAVSKKIMEITKQMITTYNSTALMITHNLDIALNYGNRLIILNEGNITLDLNEEDKKKIKKEDLLKHYHQ